MNRILIKIDVRTNVGISDVDTVPVVVTKLHRELLHFDSELRAGRDSRHWFFQSFSMEFTQSRKS